MAHDDDLAAVRAILIGRKAATLDDRCAKKVEVVRTHLRGVELFRHVAVGQVHKAAAERRDVLNHAPLRAPMGEPRRRRERTGTLRRRDHHHDQTIGIRERYRFQQHGVDDGEDRRVRAYAERQCGDGRDREARTPPEQPQRVRDVFEEGFHLVRGILTQRRDFRYIARSRELIIESDRHVGVTRDVRRPVPSSSYAARSPLRDRNPNTPAIPVPRSSSEAGSGVGAGDSGLKSKANAKLAVVEPARA